MDKSPYLDARREWNERYGTYIQSAKQWRYISFFSMAIAAMSVFGVIYFASQNKLIPYIVEVNGKGDALQVYKADTMRPIDRRVIKAQLSQFVKDVRSVSADAAVQRYAIDRAYAHLNSTMPSRAVITNWFAENVPFERARQETVFVDVQQILPLTENIWRIEWVERSRSRNGNALQKTQWTATANVVVGGEVDSKSILLNPIGLYVKEFDWSQDFENQK